MICKRCGAQSDGKSAFCPECGAAMLQADDKTVAAPDATMRADFEATQAAYGEEKTVAARDYAYEATVIAGDADIDRTVAAPNYKPEVQPNGAPQYGYPEPAPKQKKSPVVPILAGIIVVLVVALAGVIFFKDDVTGMFEKETTKSDREDKNKADGREDKDENYNDSGYYEPPAVNERYPETTINLDAQKEELSRLLADRIETEVATKIVAEVVTEIVEVYTEVVEVYTEKQERTTVKLDAEKEEISRLLAQGQEEYDGDSKGLTSLDPVAIAAFYNKAVANTKSPYIPTGYQTLVLAKNIEGDGAIGAILKVLQPAIENALKKNSKEITKIPGATGGELLATDIVKATARSKGGKTEITITLKQQVDGPDSNKNTAGPVSRGIGTLGSIDNALTELGAEITEGRDTVKLTYKNAYIKCVVNESTGRIESGMWGYTVDVLIGSAKMKLGISANLKNLSTAIDYKVVI